MEEEEFSIQWSMSIDEIRALHSSISYLIEIWPGSPARPAEEQVYLQQLKSSLFAMIMDYNFSNM